MSDLEAQKWYRLDICLLASEKLDSEWQTYLVDSEIFSNFRIKRQIF